MTITTTLVNADGGTDVLVVYEGLPRGCRSRAASGSASDASTIGAARGERG
jgi:hypothetical protein